MPELGPIMDLHYFVTDETGDAVVIEYVGGKLNIYDNEVNAITNCPVYHWHISNQRNYIGLKAYNNPPATLGKRTFSQFGSGVRRHWPARRFYTSLTVLSAPHFWRTLLMEAKM